MLFNQWMARILYLEWKMKLHIIKTKLWRVKYEKERLSMLDAEWTKLGGKKI